MKHLYRIILVSIFFMATNLQAQFIQPYLAEAGLSEAKNLVTISGDTKLYAIATKSITIASFNLTIDFDVSDGNSEAWIYVFKNDSGDDQFVGLIKSITGFVDISSQLTDYVEQLRAFVPGSALPDGTNGSAQMAEWILANNSYSNLIKKFPDAKPSEVALGNNENNANLKLDEPYWIVNFTDENEDLLFDCSVDAFTGETNCLEPNLGVANEHLSSLDDYQVAYPQPSSEFVKINIPEQIYNLQAKVSVYSIDGIELANYNMSDIYSNSWIKINTANLQSGVYLMKYQSENNNFTEKFTVLARK